MPLEILVHAPGCTIRQRRSDCPCRPQVFDAMTQASLAREAHGGDHTRLEMGIWRPPVHAHRIAVSSSQAQRHRRSISE